jgi:alpha-galactosidase
MALWALMAAPLFFSGDMTQLDEFTLNVLCNHEIIAVNQDELGQQARIVRQTDEELVLAKSLADGRVAVGLFNLGEVELPVRVGWEELGLTGPRGVRDLWRQTDLGVYATGFETPVGRHGVAVLAVTA